MKAIVQRLNLTHPGHFVGGLTLWSIWFVAIYGGYQVLPWCRLSLTKVRINHINITLLLLSLITAVLLAGLAWGRFQEAKQHKGRAAL